MGRYDRKQKTPSSKNGVQDGTGASVQRQNEVLRRLQTQFGNAVVERIMLGTPGNGFELYLADLLASERATGVDFSAYMPGQAPQEWSRFVQAWYRVLWNEQTLSPEGPSLEVENAQPALGSDSQQTASLEANGGPADPVPGDSTGADFGNLVQRKADSGAPDPSDPAALEEWFHQVRARTSGGRPLSPAEQAFMQRVHGQTLSGVRVHEGASAQQAAADIQARAFTVESEIWLGESADLSTRQGARLLAHEATHVIQNRAGRGATAQTQVSEPGQPLELEAEAAERTADQVWNERRAAWNFIPPNGLDSRAEYLADFMLDRLPVAAGQAPDTLVREALRSLLNQRANRRLADAQVALQSGLDPEIAVDQESGVFKDLSAMARAVAAATASREGLLFLLQIAGTPSASELEALQSSFAPYPSFAPQLGQALGLLCGQDPIAQAVDAARADRPSLDSGRALETLNLVRQLAPQLGLSADRIAVHTDEAAGLKTRAAGTRGLAENGAIYFDISAFESGTADATGLVAHELTHIAQESLAPATGPDAARLAEIEAAQTAWRAASGASLEAPSVGMPTGHVAAEGGGGVDGSAVIATFAANQEGVNATKGSVAPPGAGPEGGQNANASEDSARKLEQYEDGVDGICEMIEDLDAFDDLCDAIDDDEPTGGHLSRVMRNEHAARLPKMWQGAIEGGEVAGQMQSAFNDEFDGRGFWEETELAFAMICREAKSRARPEPEATAAKQLANEAETDAEEVENEQSSEEGSGEAGGDSGAEVAAIDPALAALLGASVEDIAPVIPEFETFKAISDEQFHAITSATEHRAAFSASPPDIEQGRGAQVFEALAENLLGGLTSSFTDNFVDGMVWDNVGKLGDLGINALAKGRLGTPFIGPAIALATTPPWTADAWGFGKGGPFNSLGDGWNNLGNTLEAFNSAESVGDYLGLFCAVLADVFGMLRDLITGIRAIISTLSSLCYVVGGILIIVGIALLWLAGVGAPLITAGGWLTRMGGILGRINTVLGPVVMLLSGLTTVFRTIAALMVPSDLYAQQLQGVGQDAGTFGSAVGAKLGDSAADMTNAAIATRFESRTSNPGSTPGEGGDGERLADTIDTRNQADLDRIATQARDSLDADTGSQGADPTRTTGQPDDGGTTRTPDADSSGGDSDAPSRSRLRRVVDAIPMLNRSVQGVADGLSDMKRGFTDPARFAQEGLSPQARAYVDGAMSDRIQTLDGRARQLQSQVDAIMNDPDSDASQLGSLQNELNTTRQNILDMHADITRQRDIIQGVEQTEGTLRNSADSDQDLRVIQREVDGKTSELEGANTALRQAQDDQRQQQTAVDEHAADTTHAQNDVNTNSTRAGNLETQATNTDRARSLQPTAEEARTNADSQRNALVGRTTSVDIDGTSRQRSVTDVRVNDDGSLSLQVEKTRGSPDPQWISTDDIRSNRFQTEALAAQTTEGNAQTRQSEIDTLMAPYNGEYADTSTLRQQAATDRDNQQHAQDQLDRVNDNAPDSPDQDAVTSAQNRVDSVQGELTALQTQLQAAQQASTSAGDAAANDPNAASTARHQESVTPQSSRDRGGNAVSDLLRSTSSGKATGGAGSTFKDPAESAVSAMADWLVGLDNIMGVFPDNIAQSAQVAGQKQKLTAGAMVENTVQSGLNALGMGHRETPQELKALGQTQAAQEDRRRTAVEALMACESPVEFSLFEQHRVNATLAYDAYISAHADALRAFRAEVAVGEIAATTGELAVEGGPILEASKSMAAPIQGSMATEDQRTAVISGSDSDVPAADSGMSGFIVDLVSKVGDNSDEMDEQPEAGGGDSGAKMAEGQDVAKEEATARTSQVQDASEQNKAFLTQAADLQGAQETELDTGITALEDKKSVELGIQDEIKMKKAGHLAERNRQRTIVSENSSAFSSEYEQMETWRADYETKKAAVESVY
jgi:hypothetical protein